MKSEILKIKGMNCNHCVMAVRKELQKLNINVKNVLVGSAEIEYDESKLPRKTIEQAIDEAGYKIIN